MLPRSRSRSSRSARAPAAGTAASRRRRRWWRRPTRSARRSSPRRCASSAARTTTRRCARSVGRAGGAPLAVTTTTDVWLDRTGNYRLREENDHDGGREVILTGRELAVALRYGKMIRRVAEEPEPSRMLEEGLGAPWAAFELAAPRVQRREDRRRSGRRRARDQLRAHSRRRIGGSRRRPRRFRWRGCGPGVATRRSRR